MPPHSRAQRRRQNERQQQRTTNQRVPAASPVDTVPVIAADEQVMADAALGDAAYSDVVLPRVQPAAPAVPAIPAVPAPRVQPTRAANTAAAARRPRNRPAQEPVDYTKDYAAARRDLRWIVLWAGILFAVMIALKLSGIV